MGQEKKQTFNDLLRQTIENKRKDGVIKFFVNRLGAKKKKRVVKPSFLLAFLYTLISRQVIKFSQTNHHLKIWISSQGKLIFIKPFQTLDITGFEGCF